MKRIGEMRNTYIILFALILLSCTTEKIEEIRYGRTFYAELPSCTSRTYLDDNVNQYWCSGDSISVFQSILNEKYTFSGKDGEIINKFIKCDASVPGQFFAHNYAIYPFRKNTTSSGEGCFTIPFSDTQHYAENSFGKDANVMVAVTADSEDDIFYFENICSYVILQLYGTDCVRSITITGNNNEQLSGDVRVRFSGNDISDIEKVAQRGTSVTLDCGIDGVQLEESPSTPTKFWICIPPTSFSEGFTVRVTNTYGQELAKTTTKFIEFGMNDAIPMVKYEMSLCGHNEITSYSICDEQKEYPAFSISDSLIYISVPNGLNLNKVTPIFSSNGVSVKVNGIEQMSGISTMDFSDFTAPVKYTVTSTKGEERIYRVVVFDMPVIEIETPGSQPITSKAVWIPDATILLRMPDNTTIDLGCTKIRGRGSSSWGQPKKPYAIKLESKPKHELLGMPSSKRWDLIAAWREGTLLRNDVTYMIGSQTKDLEWTPKGRFVELVLNGAHQGVYYLCEHIKIEKNRLNLTQMNPMTDLSGDPLTGAYLIEMSAYEEKGTYSFHTDILDFITFLKDPDENVNQIQLDYIKRYLDNIENLLMDESLMATRDYQNYLDIYSFADYWLVEDLVGNFDSARPKSTYFYKDRNSKLKAGPLWDFDVYTYNGNTGFVMKDSLYYRALFKDPQFVNIVKEKWNGNDQYEGLKNLASPSVINEYIDIQYQYLRRAALRDRAIWPTEGTGANSDKKIPYDSAVELMKSNYQKRYNWFDGAVNSLVVNYDAKPVSNENVNFQED